MNSAPAPRLAKTVFLAIDAGLLLTAFLIATFAPNPYAPLPFVSAVLLVALAAVIGAVPFIADYAAEQGEAARRVHEHTESQIARLHAAGESLARAAAQIKAVEEAVHKSARDAETLPYRMQEKLAEFNEALAAKESDEREALERELEELRAAQGSQLKVVADRIGKAVADWTALEAATRKQLTAAEAALAKLQAGSAGAAADFEAKTAAALQALDAKLGEFKQALAEARALPAPAPAFVIEPPPAPEPADFSPAPEPAPAPAAAPAAAFEPAAEPRPEPASAAEAPAEAPKPKKPRAPRKPKAEEILAAMSAEPESAVAAPAESSEPEAAQPAPETAPAEAPTPATESEPEPEPVRAAEPEPLVLAADEPAENEPPARAEASTSSDGATRLLATAYIGIGNKLFIRGEGPGLSWDKGVPMQFVSIGKWGWHTHDAGGPVRIKLYKNDDTPCMTGEVLLEPGKHTEVTALF